MTYSPGGRGGGISMKDWRRIAALAGIFLFGIMVGMEIAAIKTGGHEVEKLTLNVNPLKSKGMACHIAYGSDGRLFIYLWADVENGATMACEESQ